MEEITYTTNPNIRCMYCKGREVLTYMDGELININLEGPISGLGLYRCKDVRECQQNLESENTQLIVSNKGFKIVGDYDETIFEVKINDEFQGW